MHLFQITKNFMMKTMLTNKDWSVWGYSTKSYAILIRYLILHFCILWVFENQWNMLWARFIGAFIFDVLFVQTKFALFVSLSVKNTHHVQCVFICLMFGICLIYILKQSFHNRSKLKVNKVSKCKLKFSIALSF